jgi:hypothetical protein
VDPFALLVGLGFGLGFEVLSVGLGDGLGETVGPVPAVRSSADTWLCDSGAGAEPAIAFWTTPTAPRPETTAITVNSAHSAAERSRLTPLL